MGKLDSQAIAACLTDKYFELILFVTEQCNFRCTYCYEDFALGAMRPPVVSGIKNLLATRIPDLHTLRLSWFGGEPLAAKHIIYDICQTSREIAEETNPNLVFQGDMTTNGYLLTPDVAEKLVGFGITTYQISLDGTEHAHNLTRRKANGDGTFKEIWKNLKAIRDTELGFKIAIRVHYHPNNVDDLENLLTMIQSEFGGDERFMVNLQAIQKKGGPNDDELEVFSYKDWVAVEDRLLAILSRGSEENKDVPNYDGTTVCYAARGNSFAIRSDGRIAKCTVAVHDDRNIVGSLLPDGRLKIDNEKLSPWLIGVASTEKSFAGCPLAHLSI